MMEKKTWTQKIKQFYHSEYMPFAVFGIAVFLMICRVTFQDGDDTYFQQAFAQHGIFPFLKQRYFGWSARISSELSIGLMNFNLPLWKILNSCMAAFLMLCLSKFATAQIEDPHKRKIINIILCCAFFTIYPYTITSGMVWYTGSFNYLWPTVALLCALIPFYYALIGKKTVYKITYYLYFIATAYACYVEQPLAVFACFGFLTIVYLKVHKKELPNKLVAQYVFGLINITVYILAPGTRVRAGQETQWYPDFQMLTPVDKIFQAVNWTNRHYITASSLLFFLLTLLIFIVCYIRYKEDSRVVLFFSAIPMIFSALRIIPFNALFSRAASFQNYVVINPYKFSVANESTIDVQGALDKLFYNYLFYTYLGDNPSSLNINFKKLFPIIVSFTIILFVAVLLFFIFEAKYKKFVSVILYFAALVCGYVLALSPTIFASGSRVFFTGDILILLVIGLLLEELITHSNVIHKRSFKNIMYGMIAFAGIMLITYIGNYVNQTLWL